MVLTPYEICEIVIAVASITLNSMTIVVIVNRKHLHTPNNVMIGHLATADVIVGLLVAPSAIVTHMTMELDFYACVSLNSVILMFMNVPVLLLLCVTAIRFIAVRFPLTYHAHSFNTKRVMYLGGAAWIVGIVLGLIPFVWNNGVDNYESQCYFIAVIPYSYLVYFHCIGTFVTPMLAMAMVYTYIGCKLKTMQESKQEVRSIKMFVAIILVHFVSKCLLNVLNVMAYFQIDPPWDKDTGHTLLLSAILLDRSNSIVNPFIYAFGNKKIKEEMPNRGTITNIKDKMSTGAPFTPKTRKIMQAMQTRRKNTPSTKTTEASSNNETPTPGLNITQEDQSSGATTSGFTVKEEMSNTSYVSSAIFYSVLGKQLSSVKQIPEENQAETEDSLELAIQSSIKLDIIEGKHNDKLQQKPPPAY